MLSGHFLCYHALRLNSCRLADIFYKYLYRSGRCVASLEGCTLSWSTASYPFPHEAAALSEKRKL